MSELPLFAARSARPALRTQADLKVTSTGVVIGARHVPPRPVLSADAEALQTALLSRRNRAAAWVRPLAAGLAAFTVWRARP
jgi:hypothetical protein